MMTTKSNEIERDSNIIAHPGITLQEEPDCWGLLYDPRSDFSLGINPESLFLWKQLKNKTTINNIAARIKESFIHVPDDIENEVTKIVKGFLKLGFVTISPDEVTGLDRAPVSPGN